MALQFSSGYCQVPSGVYFGTVKFNINWTNWLNSKLHMHFFINNVINENTSSSVFDRSERRTVSLQRKEKGDLYDGNYCLLSNLYEGTKAKEAMIMKLIHKQNIKKEK